MYPFKTILVILAWLALAFPAQSQWTKMPTVLQTRPTQLVEINGKILAVDDYGLAKSTNNGVHWQRTATTSRIAQLLTADNLLYGISQDVNVNSERALLRSADEGESWDTLAVFVLPQPTRMLKVGDFFYFMTQQFGGPSTVQVFDTNTSQLTQLGYFYSGFFDLQYAYELKSIGNYVFFASDWGLIRYQNGGSQVDTLDHNKVSMLGVRGDTLFAHGIYDFFYSVDAGDTWTEIPYNNNLPYAFIEKLYFQNGRSLMLGLDAYNSCSNVRLWECDNSFSQGTQKLLLKDGNCIKDVLITPSGALMVATNNDGILTLDPSDETWFVQNTGLGGYFFKATRQDDLLVAGGLFSRDTGQTWFSPLVSAVSYYSINSIVKKDSFYYAAISYNGLSKSPDLKTWEPLVYWVPHINKVGNYLMTTTADGRIQLSTDGLNWTTTNHKLQQSYFPPNQIQGGIIYDLRYDPGLGRITFQSTYDLGATWQNPGLDFLESGAEEFQEMAAWQSNIYLLTHDPQTQIKKLYASHDFGYNWKRIAVPTDYLGYKSFTCTDQLLFATDYTNIWVTANDGESWIALDRDTFGGTINNLDVSFGKLWVSTETEFWARDIGGIDLEMYQGVVFHDQNLNNIRDAGEPGIPDIVIKVSNRDWYVVTDSTGGYTIRAELVNDSIAAIRPITYCTVVPAIIAANPAQFTNNDFAVQIQPGITDAGVTAVNAQVFRPGFTTAVWVAVGNEGTTTLDSVRLMVPPPGPFSPLQLLDATPPPDQLLGDTMVWNNLNIAIFDQKDVQIRYATKANASLSERAQLYFSVLQPGDQQLMNNHYSLTEPLLGAYDPNDKRVQPDTLPPGQLAQTDLLYTIRFQNTGNYPADFVTILDTLPDDLNVATIKVLAASHPYRFQIKDGRVLEFRFDPIFLPDSTSNEAGSHGFVQFAIRAQADLPLGKVIPNRAAIYFDYNPPVMTEYARMHVENPVSATSTGLWGAPMAIAPNPANDRVWFEKPTDSPGMLKIYREDGRLMVQQSTTQKSVAVMAGAWPSGWYVAQWTSGGKTWTGKFVKL